VVACLAILADKDAKAIIENLAPALTYTVCTQLPSSQRLGLEAEELLRICEASGIDGEADDDLGAAVARGRELALEQDGVLLVTGSHYALAPARAALGLSA
jgi:folylpolyglutamate synthase/dihydropteroate synthase